jgi:hypothetical protein
MTLFEFSRRSLFRRMTLLALVLVPLLLSVGCSPEEPPATELTPVLGLSPKSWSITESLPPGIRVYKKITITNAQDDEGGTIKVKDLEVKSIVLAANANKQFKIIEDKCPIGADEKECVDFPSLPAKLKPGQKIEFTIEFTASDIVGAKVADILIETNGKNKKQEDWYKEKLRVQSLGGEPLIDISLQLVGTKEMILPLKKTAKGQATKDTFTVTNLGNATLEFKLSFEKTDPDFKVTVDGKDAIGQDYKLDPSDNKEFTVTYTPSKCGSHEARIKVSSNAVPRAADPKKGTGVSSPTLYIRASGSSPTGGVAEPSIVEFKNIKAGSKDPKDFTLAVNQQGICDLEVKQMEIAALDNNPAPKDLKIIGYKKDGKTVTLPVNLAKGEKLTVTIEYAPKKQGGESGVIKVVTNDPSLDSSGIVTIIAGTEVNLPPRASFRFYCDEDGSSACKKGDDVGLTLFRSGERGIWIKLDGSKSTDREKKLVEGVFTIVNKPRGSQTVITSADKAKLTARMRIDGDGPFKIKLTVKDDAGQTHSIEQTLTVQP